MNSGMMVADYQIDLFDTDSDFSNANTVLNALDYQVLSSQIDSIKANTQIDIQKTTILKAFRKALRENLIINRPNHSTSVNETRSDLLISSISDMYLNLRDSTLTALLNNQNSTVEPEFSVFYPSVLGLAQLDYMEIEQFSWQLMNADQAIRQTVETDTQSRKK